MISQTEMRATTLLTTNRPMVWARRTPKRRHAYVKGVGQMRLEHFLEGGMFHEDDLPEVRLDEDEYRRTVGRLLRHDLLNKLTVAQGGLDLYERSKEDRFLDMAKRNLEACNEILGKMSALEKPSGPTKLSPVDVASVAQVVIRGHQGRGVDLQVLGQGWAMADAALFHVLENLVSNAIRHGAPSIVVISIEEKGNRTLIKVADDGNGIPLEARKDLFKEGHKFGPRGNTGLGLYIVKRIVQRYRGNITMMENVPKGTAFCIELRKVI